jgi:hypothetical protein
MVVQIIQRYWSWIRMNEEKPKPRFCHICDGFGYFEFSPTDTCHTCYHCKGNGLEPDLEPNDDDYLDEHEDLEGD